MNKGRVLIIDDEEIVCVIAGVSSLPRDTRSRAPEVQQKGSAFLE